MHIIIYFRNHYHAGTGCVSAAIDRYAARERNLAANRLDKRDKMIH